MLRHSFAFALPVATERTKNALKNVSTPGKWKTGFAQQHTLKLSQTVFAYFMPISATRLPL